LAQQDENHSTECLNQQGDVGRSPLRVNAGGR
jgi:hypothetical protein